VQKQRFQTSSHDPPKAAAAKKTIGPACADPIVTGAQIVPYLRYVNLRSKRYATYVPTQRADFNGPPAAPSAPLAVAPCQ
jgi:hypothetical protein